VLGNDTCCRVSSASLCVAVAAAGMLPLQSMFVPNSLQKTKLLLIPTSCP
jgi:hypothetical protein